MLIDVVYIDQNDQHDVEVVAFTPNAVRRTKLYVDTCNTIIKKCVLSLN